MADSKLTALTELTALDGDEQFYVVDDDDGTPTSKRITVENVRASIGPSAAEVATDQSAGSSGSYVDLSTVGPAVTVTVPASGVVVVTISAYVGVAGGDQTLWMSPDLSGANTVAAADANSVSIDLTTLKFRTVTGVILLSGLTPGSTTFTVKYKKSSSGASSFSLRTIVVQPLP